MKYSNLLLLPIILLILSLLNSCAIDGTNKFNGFYGSVKEVTDFHYEFEDKFGEWTISEYDDPYYFKTEYNRDGNLSSLAFYFGEGNINYMHKYKYDDDQLIEHITYDNEGKTDSKTSYVWISDRMAKFVEINTDGEKISEGSLLLKNSRVFESSFNYFDSIGEVESTTSTSNSYSDNGILLSFSVQDNDKTDIYWYEYVEFDEKRNPTKKLVFMNEETEPTDIWISEYEYY